MAAILYAILDFEECQQGISGDFLSVILHIIPGPILKKSACYQKCPPFGALWPNTTGLEYLLSVLPSSHRLIMADRTMAQIVSKWVWSVIY